MIPLEVSNSTLLCLLRSDLGIASNGGAKLASAMISAQNAANASVVGGSYGKPERERSCRAIKSVNAYGFGEG